MLLKQSGCSSAVRAVVQVTIPMTVYGDMTNVLVGVDDPLLPREAAVVVVLDDVVVGDMLIGVGIAGWDG